MLKGKLLAEGKTKKIWRVVDNSTNVLIESKDDITAGDGARRDVMSGKGVLSTRTAVNCFAFLNRRGIRTHLIRGEDDHTFLAMQCAMIPLEIVTRRIATGSFLKRRPDVKEGTTFDPLVCELFFKNDARHDPMVIFDPFGDRWLMFEAKKPLGEGFMGELPAITPNGFPDIVLKTGQVMALREFALQVFLALEQAWHTCNVDLVDLKIEAGVVIGQDGTPYQPLTLYVADIIDNDSWRIWPGGDKTKMVDKQVYRDLTVVSAEELGRIRKNYQWVAEQTDRFAELS